MRSKILNKKNLMQLFIIMLVVWIFSISATISLISNKGNKVNILIWDGIVMSLFIILLSLYVKMITLDNIKNNIITIIKKNRCIFIMLLVISVLRIVQIGFIPRWDTEDYIYALRMGCEKFDFTLSSYVESFSLCSHTSLGYSLFIAIGMFLFPNSMIGVNIVNLILTIIAFNFVFKILLSWTGCSQKYVALVTLLISMCPIILGTFYNVNLDYPIMIFMIYIIYMHMKGYNILFFFFSLILIQSKECGVILLAGYLFGFIISYLLKSEKSFKEKIKLLINNKIFLFAFLSCLLMLFYEIYVMFFSENVRMWNNGLTKESDDLTINYFGVNLEYILLKIKSVIIFNMSWLCIVVTIVLTIIGIVRRKFEKNILSNQFFLSSISAVSFYFVFCCIYVTHNNPRYLMVINLASFMLLGVLILVVIDNGKWKKTMIIILIICFGCEAYTTVDLFTAKLFNMRTTDTLLGISLPAWNGNEYIADTSVYNFQNTYMDRAYDKILESFDYDETKDILLLGQYDTYVRSMYLSGRYFQYEWDDEKAKRVMVGNENTHKLNLVYENNFMNLYNAGELRKEAVLIINPEYGVDEEQIVSFVNLYYDVSDKKVINELFQGKVYYYILHLK